MPRWKGSPVAEWLALNAAALALALGLDAILGEPDWLWRRMPHPVVLVGRLIGWLDRRLNRAQDTAGRRRLMGVLALMLLVVPTMLAVGVPLALAHALHPALGFAFSVLAGAVLLAQRSLHEHVEAVRAPLAAGDLAAARAALSMIVGRDTSTLDESGIARAALESLAENHADGVIAPAFWMLVGGPVGIAFYKAANTADSMIGHRTERHRAFGWAAARLDDLLNLAPARLAPLLVALGALGARLLAPAVPPDLPDARTVLTDAPTHASPNAGWPEAAYASALGVALGGPRQYAGYRVEAPFLNHTGRRDIGADDIKAGLLLFRATCAVTTLLVLAVALLAL